MQNAYKRVTSAMTHLRNSTEWQARQATFSQFDRTLDNNLPPVQLGRTIASGTPRLKPSSK